MERIIQSAFQGLVTPDIHLYGKSKTFKTKHMRLENINYNEGKLPITISKKSCSEASRNQQAVNSNRGSISGFPTLQYNSRHGINNSKRRNNLHRRHFTSTWTQETTLYLPPVHKCNALSTRRDVQAPNSKTKTSYSRLGFANTNTSPLTHKTQ